MKNFSLKQIGKIVSGKTGFEIRIEKEYRNALTGIDGFSWLNILWWADQLDDDEYRKILTTDKPYKKGPEELGVFATRSPLRPNPIAITASFISGIDKEAGVLYTPYIDAEENTPVLDIKPYLGCTDRINSLKVPDWCSDWPSTVEESASFDWESIFNF